MTDNAGHFRFVNPRPRKKRRPNPAWVEPKDKCPRFTTFDSGAAVDKGAPRSPLTPTTGAQNRVPYHEYAAGNRGSRDCRAPCPVEADPAPSNVAAPVQDPTASSAEVDTMALPTPSSSWMPSPSAFLTADLFLPQESNDDGHGYDAHADLAIGPLSFGSPPPSPPPPQPQRAAASPAVSHPPAEADCAVPNEEPQNCQGPEEVGLDYLALQGDAAANTVLDDFFRMPQFDFLSFANLGARSLRDGANTARPPPSPGPLFSPLAPSVTFQSLIENYNHRFCALPITSDFPANPFRCRLGHFNLNESTPLLHGFLAIAYYHMSREMPGENTFYHEIQHHMTTAKQSFKHKMEDRACRSPNLGSMAALLDTLVLIFTFEAAHSAQSDWIYHLKCALSLLERAGGLGALSKSTRLQTQVCMCIWWDVTISMISREDTVFPYSCFDALLSLEDKGSWSFFDLTGCPRELFVPLVQLTHMAAEKEKLSKMRFATFDFKLADEIEKSILAWVDGPAELEAINDTDEDVNEETIHLNQDRVHCYKAWQYGLLLYIQRVFRWDRKSPPSARITILARKALDHIQACRLSSLVSKQILMPIFLSGAEVLNDEYCAIISKYCREWHKRSGYQPFAYALTVLETIWRERRASGSHTIWWGSVIDDMYRGLGKQRLKLG